MTDDVGIKNDGCEINDKVGPTNSIEYLQHQEAFLFVQHDGAVFSIDILFRFGTTC
jgi:hypothetical protein